VLARKKTGWATTPHTSRRGLALRLANGSMYVCACIVSFPFSCPLFFSIAVNACLTLSFLCALCLVAVRDADHPQPSFDLRLGYENLS